ncbi:MAG TPA: MFS transporter [Pyrinomonadaceae bacterium]|jgi:MFS family permease|nr:MFS transporter [Pyrinomonadaceae bacterium]
MGETDTDAADQFDASISRDRLGEATTGLWQRYNRLPRNVLIISLVSFLNDASSEVIYPLLPLFLFSTLGATPAAIGLIEGAAESVSSLLKLFSGYFSDRHGRRKGLVVVGYALASFARPLLAFASSWPQVLTIRVTDRVGKGIRSAPRDAMIADAATPMQRGLAFGFHRAMDHLGAVIGPLLGLIILLWVSADANSPQAADYTKVFLVASVPALASVLVAAFFIRETHGRERHAEAAAAVVAAAAAGAVNGARVNGGVAALEPPRLSLGGFDSNFKRFLVILALFTLANSSDVFLLLRAREAGSGATTLLLTWAALHTVKVLSSLVGGNLSDRLGRKTLIASGWLLYAAVYAGFAFISSVGMAWALFMVYGVYFGLAEGAEKALVADLVRPEQRGTAYGLYNLAFGITVFPASLLMGLLWNWRGAQTAFLVSASIGALAALLLVSTVSARPQAARSD